MGNRTILNLDSGSGDVVYRRNLQMMDKDQSQ